MQIKKIAELLTVKVIILYHTILINHFNMRVEANNWHGSYYVDSLWRIFYSSE